MKLYALLFAVLLVCVSQGTKIIDDFSQLNKTVVADIVYPVTVQEIQQVLLRAQQENKKISLAGKRHSQGGHAFYPDAIVIDICQFNKIINLDIADRLITVQTGATWEQIQDYINPHGLALKVTQTAQIFTVGGSLSVNAHGRDPRHGPLIETIRAIRILLASGEIVEASRERNAELFRLAIGGYGLFGIILEADIELTENRIYQKCAQVVPIEEYPAFIDEQVLPDPQVELHYGILSVAPYNFLKEMVVVNYKYHPNRIFSARIRRRACTLRHEDYVQLSGTVFDLRMKNSVVHRLLQMVDWPCTVLREKMSDVTCRNNAMRFPTRLLEYTASANVHALCSYFIPPESFASFIDYVRTSCTTYGVELAAVLTRYIASNTESFLSYTDRDRIEVVIFLIHQNSEAGVATMQNWTRATVQHVLANNGMYYLPGNLHPTYDQITIAYPQLPVFFAHKKEYDPSELFVNCFYMKYAPLCNQACI